MTIFSLVGSLQLQRPANLYLILRNVASANNSFMKQKERASARTESARTESARTESAYTHTTLVLINIPSVKIFHEVQSPQSTVHS